MKEESSKHEAPSTKQEEETTVCSLSAHRQNKWVPAWPSALAYTMAAPLLLTWTPDQGSAPTPAPVPAVVKDPATGEIIPFLPLMPEPGPSHQSATKLRTKLDKILFHALSAVKNTYYEEDLSDLLSGLADDGDYRWAISKMRELLAEDDEPAELRLLARLIDFAEAMGSTWARLADAEKEELETLKQLRA